MIFKVTIIHLIDYNNCFDGDIVCHLLSREMAGDLAQCHEYLSCKWVVASSIPVAKNK